MMGLLNLLFAALDVVAGLGGNGASGPLSQRGEAGLMTAYVPLKAPYSIGQTEYARAFFFWLAYDLAMLAAIWFEMGKRRHA